MVLFDYHAGKWNVIKENVALNLEHSLVQSAMEVDEVHT